MTRYFKCVRPDGRDFHTGTIDYAAALATGLPITHPNPGRSGAGGYLSVSVSPSDCTGMEWPCRLFEVEPGAPWAPDSVLRSKRACHSLRVVEELPAHEALGPQGEHVAALIDRAQHLTHAEATRLAAAWAAAEYAAWYTAWYAAGDAAEYAARYAAWYAAGDAAEYAAEYAARAAAWAAAWAAARAAAGALIIRDLISAEHYDVLSLPWRTAVGPIHPDDPDNHPPGDDMTHPARSAGYPPLITRRRAAIAAGGLAKTGR